MFTHLADAELIYDGQCIVFKMSVREYVSRMFVSEGFMYTVDLSSCLYLEGVLSECMYLFVHMRAIQMQRVSVEIKKMQMQ